MNPYMDYTLVGPGLHPWYTSARFGEALGDSGISIFASSIPAMVLLLRLPSLTRASRHALP